MPRLVDSYRAGGTASRAKQEKAQAIVATSRERLSTLSWLMRSLNEDLARRANTEDVCKGRFWEGRFKSQALLDEAAILTCMSYVDLNPVRVGMADCPENSDLTSIQQRIIEYTKGSNESATDKPHVTPLVNPNQDLHQNAFSFTSSDYLELLDWSGRAIREDKRSATSSSLPPILKRLKLDPEYYFEHLWKGGRELHVAALGR